MHMIIIQYNFLYRRTQLLENNKHEMSMVCLRETSGESQSQLNNYENMYHLQEIEEQKLNQQRREAEIRQRLQAEQQELQRQQYEVENQVLETQRQEAERRELERLEAERLEAERLEAQRIEAELNTQRKLQTSNHQFMHQHHTSSLTADAEEHLLGQSLTVNTKEAISMVQGLWQQSPDTSLRFRGHPVAPRIVDTRNKLPFDIHMDGSMTQHAMSNNKPHHQGYNMQVYNDQENHHHSFHAQHHSYSSQEQTGYGNHSLQNSYHYQMQVNSK